MKVNVRSGDSWWSISKIFQVPLMILKESNRQILQSPLKSGEEIHIPGYEMMPYRIRNGDTFWKIAADHHILVDSVMILNQQKSPNHLLPGEMINLPQKIISPCIQTDTSCDSTKLTKVINELKHQYPFISVTTIGKSVLGKPIQEIRVGKGMKKVHINASFHANEWITTLISMSLLNTYLLALTNTLQLRGHLPQKWYQNLELSLVPMVNPDGVDLVLHGPPSKLKEKILKINGGDNEFVHWKANIRGVDLNKQYPANWEIDQKRKAPKSPAPRDYPGKSPLTEPEAIAMAEIAQNTKFDCVLAFHTQGEELYWGYEGHEPTESAIMAKEFEQQSGYKAIQYVDSHGGYKDWFIQEFKRPGFTIEFGRGINPLPLSHFNDILQKAKGIFFTALSMI